MDSQHTDSKDIQDNKVMGILAYLGILVLVPLFAAKESKFARFHANQGLILLICAIIWQIVAYILMFFLAKIGLSFLSIIISLLSIVFLVLIIIGIINAAKGEMKELPIIGKFRILK
jgi:uncharacterized membrane protein